MAKSKKRLVQEHLSHIIFESLMGRCFLIKSKNSPLDVIGDLYVVISDLSYNINYGSGSAKITVFSDVYDSEGKLIIKRAFRNNLGLASFVTESNLGKLSPDCDLRKYLNAALKKKGKR